MENQTPTNTTPSAKKILLVEDEPLLGNLLKQRLEKEGFQVSLAKDGEEVFSILKLAISENKTPDLMLMDVILPKASGFEVLETLSKDPQYPKIPVIIISNLGQDTDISRGKDLGAVSHFVKAKVSIEELVKKTKDFILGTPQEKPEPQS